MGIRTKQPGARAVWHKENIMTKCESMQMKIDEYMTKAILAKDVDVKAFFYKASKFLEEKRDGMTVEELIKEV